MGHIAPLYVKCFVPSFGYKTVVLKGKISLIHFYIPSEKSMTYKKESSPWVLCAQFGRSFDKKRILKVDIAFLIFHWDFLLGGHYSSLKQT